MKNICIAAAIIAICGGLALWCKSAIAPARPARVVFVGDMMFDRTIRAFAEAKGYGYPLSCAKGYLAGFDLAVGNLEGPITASPSASRGTVPGDANNTRFTFDPRVAPALAEAGFGAVSLANNHIYDFGRDGVASTVAALDAAGVRSFGAPGRAQVATTSVAGRRLAFVAFNEFLGEADPERAISAIWKADKEADFVAVYAHWGAEYGPENGYQRALAHRFIDAGADLVVGAHPHVIQGHEAYQGGHIYYSLGNFVFDQYWNEGVRTGLALEAEIGDGGVEVSERRVAIDRSGVVCPEPLE